MIKKIFFSILFIFGFAADLFAATYVNDGGINWNGNWQTTANIDTLHASTNLAINTTARYTKQWGGNASNVNKGVLIYITGVATIETVTVQLEQNSLADGTGTWANATGGSGGSVSTTLVVDGTSKANSWYYFKYADTHAETAGTANYRVKITGNAAGTTTTARADATTTTAFGKIQVLNATGIPATAGDVAYICGITQASTGNPTAATVIMNVSLDGTAYGNITICNGGTLSYGNTAATTYYLEVAGNIDILNGGTLTMNGASATLSTLEMNTTSADRFIYVRAGGIFTATGKAFIGNVWRTTTTDAISVTTDRTVALNDNVQTAVWAANDQIIISTTTNLGDSEEKTISSVSGSSLTITTDWTATHLTGAEICNLTRNVIITSPGTNDLNIDVYTTTVGAVDFDWVQFKDIDNPTDVIIRSEADNFAYSVDYCSFDDCFQALGIANDLTKDLTFTNLCFWFNGNHYRAINFAGSSLTPSQTIGIVTLSDITIAKSSNTVDTSAIYCLTPAILNNVNIYDSVGTNVRTGANLTAVSKLTNVKIWGIKGYGLGNTLGPGVAVANDFSMNGYNCVFGGDGTNIIANTTSDFSATTLTRSNFYNTKFLSTTEITLPTSPYSTYNSMFSVNSHNHDATAGRYKAWRLFGTISDQITGGQTAAWARGGSGTCVYMYPTSATDTLDWEFYVPVTASTSFSVHAYVKEINAPTLTCTIYDSNDDNTVKLNAESVSLTTDWTEYTSTPVTPTATGFCRVVFKATSGGVMSCIGIDDVHLATDVNVDYGNMDRWANGLPAPYITDSTTGGGATEFSHGYAD